MPWLRNQRLNVDGLGNVSLGSWWENYNLSPLPSAAGVRNTWTTPEWFLGLQWTGTVSQRANGQGTVYTTTDSSNPVDAFSWGSVNTSFHRASLAGWTGSTIELFYVR
jgi:hypothetical protein